MTLTPPAPGPTLPEELSELRQLALDLRGSWSHTADALWRRIDRDLWHRTHNPWLILHTVSRRHLQRLAQDPEFRALLTELRGEQQQAQGAPSWFDSAAPSLSQVAYFSMEYGLSEALPIYSGGLGVLAGDHLKTASELGIPLVAVGLLYQQGYFRQGLDAEGNQLAFYPYNDPTQLPIQPVRDAEDGWRCVRLELPGRPLHLRLWQVQVGRIRLYLLDGNHPLNEPADRGITSELYGGGLELRLQQEMVLGIGGYRLLSALGITPEVCHLNEGHAAFVVLERARTFMESTGVDFATALTSTRAGNLFTTHTPVAAGFDRFPPGLFARYMAPYAETLGIPFAELLALGRGPGPQEPQTPFHMAWLALHGSGRVNAVSRVHAQVSRGLFQALFPRWPRLEVPLGAVTNGVHTPSWEAPESDRLWTEACGEDRWRGELDRIGQAIEALPDTRLWEMRARNRARLVGEIRERLGDDDLLDPNALTLGFARRFATYKRPNLLLHDRGRLLRLLSREDRPVQLLVAGKAHPQDRDGQAMIREWIHFIRDRALHRQVIFLPDYDLSLAETLVQGVDLWINTPRRPWEACGTSGMKVLANGGLNLSERDGWWAEAWRPGLGWALGDGHEHGDDPAWDAREAAQLYDLIEGQVIPAFYERDPRGVPTAWVERMRHSMATLTPRFSSNRMVREYTRDYYAPLASAYRARSARGAALARDILRWRGRIRRHWPAVHFGRLDVHSADHRHLFAIQVYLDDLGPEAVRVELYAEPMAGDCPERHPLTAVSPLPGAVNGWLYQVEVADQRPASDYTVRVRPHHPQASVPLEAAEILWQR